ncbi:MAG TPA: endonuclease III [Chloroflexota bacterium]
MPDDETPSGDATTHPRETTPVTPRRARRAPRPGLRRTADGDADAAALRQRLAAVLTALEEVYGPAEPPRRVDPLDELVYTVLSQHSSDTNTDRTYASLRATFGTWEAVRDAPPSAIADAIRHGGLAEVKAPRLKSILERITERCGRLDLSLLHDMELEEARRFLLSLDGVGPKTAACVLLFACGKPALPVDTHVHRVSRRLGFIDARASAEEAHTVLEALVPPEQVLAYHVHLIRHGRRVCKAPRPRCEACVVSHLCPSTERR